jgi:tRNA uracil 4-sulfurtransferase
MVKTMKGMLLISSGIDSPVAGRMMADRGVELFGIHLSLHDDEKEKEKIITLAKKARVKRLFFADLRPSHHAFAKNCNPRLTCVFCKRTMLRIAEKIAEKEGCDFLITGENMGQVASQTLDNMIVTDRAVKMKILRPLLGFDKVNIIDLARKFGSYELSIEKSPGCPFLPEHPATTSKSEALEMQEGKLAMEELVGEAANQSKVAFDS